MNIYDILHTLSSPAAVADPQTRLATLVLLLFLGTATCRLSLACFIDLGSQGVNLMEKVPLSALPIGAGLLTMVGPFVCLEFTVFAMAWGTVPIGASAIAAATALLSYAAFHQSFFRAIHSDHPRALW